MNFKVLKGDLVTLMPSEIVRSNWKNTLGSGFVLQITDKLKQETITILEILDSDLWNAVMGSSDVETLTSLSQVNTLITEHNEDVYIKENEGLMSANLNYLVSQGQIDFLDLAVEMSEQEELAYLHSKGCSGISKKKKYQLLAIE